MTASFLPKPVVGVNGSGMHTNVSVTQGRQEPVLGSQGRREALRARLAVRRPHPDARQRHLPGAQLQRQRLSPARSALRGAEPDQGLGRRSRLDGPHPDRQRAQLARRGSLGRAGREPYMVLLRVFKTGLDGEIGRSKTCARPSATCPTTSTPRSRTSEGPQWTTKLLGEDVKARYAELKQACADRCPRLLGTFVKAPRSAVPPRGLQPVPLEPVLKTDSRQSPNSTAARRIAPNAAGRPMA